MLPSNNPKKTRDVLVSEIDKILCRCFLQALKGKRGEMPWSLHLSIDQPRQLVVTFPPRKVVILATALLQPEGPHIGLASVFWILRSRARNRSC